MPASGKSYDQVYAKLRKILPTEIRACFALLDPMAQTSGHFIAPDEVALDSTEDQAKS